MKYRIVFVETARHEITIETAEPIDTDDELACDELLDNSLDWTKTVLLGVEERYIDRIVPVVSVQPVGVEVTE